MRSLTSALHLKTHITPVISDCHSSSRENMMWPSENCGFYTRWKKGCKTTDGMLSLCWYWMFTQLVTFCLISRRSLSNLTTVSEEAAPILVAPLLRLIPTTLQLKSTWIKISLQQKQKGESTLTHFLLTCENQYDKNESTDTFQYVHPAEQCCQATNTSPLFWAKLSLVITLDRYVLVGWVLFMLHL